MKQISTYIFLLVSTLFSLVQAQPVARQGVLDLRELDYTQHSMVPLSGEWEFYWNRIYSAQTIQSDQFKGSPDFIDYMTPWSDLPQTEEQAHSYGYATMRLKILCGDKIPSLSLYIPEVYTAYDLYVNGEGFEGNGLVGSTRETSIPYWRPSSKVVNLHPGENELVLHLSNFHHHKGGTTSPIVLGTSDEINYWRNFKISSTLFLAGCLLIAGALAFGFYWFNPTDYTGLFFFLFCGAYMYRLLGTEEYVIHAALRVWNVPWSITLRMEYFSLYLSVIFYVYFIRNLIQPRVKLIVFHTMASVSGLLALLSLVLPTQVFTSFMDPYLVLLGACMIAVGMVYLFKLNLRHKTTYVTLIGGVMLFVVVAQKILNYYHIIEENLMLTTAGYVVFICSQAVAMTIRFGRNFREKNTAAQIAAKSKDQFLNTMSHELRTPMNAILGMTDLLERSNLKDDQKEKVTTIKKNGESLLSIIMDILSITDIESGKFVLEKQLLNVRECVEGAYNLALKERRMKVEFVKDVNSNVPDKLLGDSIRLKQILMHLLSNAFKFTEEGSVRLGVKVISEKDQDIELHFSIEDTGIGISQTTQSKLFSVFSQADSRNNRKFGGAGLGLAVVRQMVGLMGGEVEMESEAGKGTKVSFNIKLEKAEVHQEAPAEKKVYRPTEIDAKLRILYAEDNPVNQKLLTMMMKTMGLDIDIAANGREAWEMARENHYHIILMDIQMPEMDGIEATRKIVRDMDLRPIIIAVTANATISDKKKCFEAGMNDFITKPIKAGDLKEGILKWQSLRKYLDDIDDRPEPKYIQLSS
ncbi:MAG: response regulator [Owenweeksia sp.]